MLKRLICFLIDLFYIFCMGYLLYYFTINDNSYIINQKGQMCVECSGHNLATFHMFLYDIMIWIEIAAIVASVWIASAFIPLNNILFLLLKVVILFLVFQSKDILASALIQNNYGVLLKCEFYCSIASLSIQVLIKYVLLFFKDEDANE